MKVNFVKLNEVEIQRQNVTPRQFWSYCKREIERRTGGALHLSDWLEDFGDWETPTCESKWHKDEHESWGEDARTEVIRYEPFGCQWYLQGSYNFIMEFDFYDEKTGFGYLYMCDMEEVPTEPEEPTETEPEQPETETEPETATANEEEHEMLRTNTKKARENVRAYIMNGFEPEYNDNITPNNFEEAAVAIMADFRRAKGHELRRRYANEQEVFIDWCAGLPGIIDTCYYYNRSAVEDLGGILEETAAEKARYTESKAERLLSCLIYSECSKAERKARERAANNADTSDIERAEAEAVAAVTA